MQVAEHTFMVKRRRIIRKLGYISDQKGIIKRYLREANGWALHLQNSKEAILRTMDILKPKSMALLGSGWLLDVPVDEIINQGITLYCLDISHPEQIKHNYRNEESSKFIEVDLNGSLSEKIYHYYKIGKKQIVSSDLDPDCRLDLTGYEMVVSLNILNQLDILLLDFVKEHQLMNEEELKKLRMKIQEHHLKMLPCEKSCIIFDYCERIFSDEDEQEQVNSTVFVSLPHMKNVQEWQWQFDSLGYYYNGKRVVFDVKAGIITS